jgi:hypothetical protein
MATSYSKTPLFGVAIRSLWRSLQRDLFDTYRPERHYMRGPGPRWHAKHGMPFIATAMIADAPI